MKTLFIAFRAAIFGTGFIFLWGWIALDLHRRYDATLGFALAAWAHALGIAMMAAGGTLAFACAAGPYQFVRNPMYVGGFIVLLGFGFYEQSPAILLFALPWLLLAHLFVILYEEPHLHATFGAPYDAYCRSVHRWLPVPSPRVNSRLAIQHASRSQRVSGELLFRGFSRAGEMLFSGADPKRRYLERFRGLC
jgi:hypothetical protein